MQNANESNANTSAQAQDGTQQPANVPPKKKVAPTSRENLDLISRVLRGESADAPPDDEAPPDDDAPPKQLKSLDDIAKILKRDPASLYDIEIPLRAGSEKKSMKLGELKDYFDSQDDHRLSKIEWEEERGKQEAELSRSRAELAEIMKMIPPDKLTPDVLNTVRTKQDAIVVSERKRTLERIPAWRDENTRAQELQLIADHLADYGFPASALTQLYDHRMLAYLRDNALRLQRLNVALEKVKAHRAPSTAPRSKGGNGAPSNAPASPRGALNTVDRQVSEVSKLLRG